MKRIGLLLLVVCLLCLSVGMLLAPRGADAQGRPHRHPHRHPHHHPHHQPTPTPTVQVPPPAYSVMGMPTITAANIDRVLCKVVTTDHPQVSAACGTGTDLYALGVKYGIDPVYALAWFQHESTFGRYGVARVTLSLGNIRCTPGYHCVSGFRAYTSWQQGYENWYQLIRYYCGTLHLTTVAQIIPVYAPASENNVQAYIAAVETSVNAWRAGQY